MATWDGEFSAFAAARGASMYRTALLLCGNAATAEDLVQTALARLYVAWPRVTRRDELDGYVRTMVTRVFIDERRRPWRREESTAELPAQVSEPYAAVDERDRLMRALSLLPEKQRAVVVLRVWEDLSVEQAAHALDVSTGTVKSQLAKGLERLRLLLTSSATEVAG